MACVFAIALLVSLDFAARKVIAQSMDRPNFVVIMADDLGYGDIGCFGNERIRTPNLDRIAAEGMRLVDFHSSGAVCSPTRAGLVTGRYQQRAGIPAVIVADPTRPTHPHGLQDEEITFAELLGGSGYQTAIFGKWHLGYYRKYNPVRHGFGEFRGYISGNVDYFSHVDQAGRLDWWRGDQIDDEPGYTTHLITKYAREFIESQRDHPFCLYVAYEPPHYPYQGPHDRAVRTVGSGRGKAETKQQADDIQRAYKEMVESMDEGVGEILAQLQRSGIDKKTLVLFFSDNGANARGNNGGLRGHKGQVWEGGHRVPFIARWPGRIPKGGESDELAITLDIMPTLLAAADISPPEDRPLDGVNLLPLLTRGKPLGNRQLFWAHGNGRAMRDGPWKLVVGERDQKKPTLFDLDNDLGEQRDVSSEYPDRVATMLAALKKWERDVTSDAPRQPDQPPRESAAP